MRYLFRSKVALLIVVVGVTCWNSFVFGDDIATWDRGGGNNRWSDNDNWFPRPSSILHPNGPINGNGTQFDVRIPSNFTVDFDTTSFSTVTTFRLDNNATLNLLPGTDLSITTAATISGILNVNTGNFFAVNGTASLGGNRARLSVQNGRLEIIAPTYSSTGLVGGEVILSSAGSGSLLDLSSLTSMNAGFNDFSRTVRAQQVNATDSGVIDLSGVMSITSPVQSTDRLDITVNSGGQIDLSSLKTIAGTGQVKVTMNGATGGATMKLGSLEAAHRTFFTLTNGAMVTDGGLAAAGDPGLISDSTFSVSSGSKFMAATVATSYSSTGLTGGGDIFTSAGSGSLLDLSSLTSINAGFNDFSRTVRAQQVNATDSGVIDLSGVMSITSPVQSTDRLDITVNSGGEIDLSSLKTIAGAGQVLVNLDGANNGATMKLGSLEAAHRTFFTLTNGAMVTDGGLAAVGTPGLISDSTFSVSSGSKFMAATVATSYSSTGLTGGGDIFTSAGSGSLLDLSSLTSMNAGFNDFLSTVRAQQVNATDSGVIDLSGVMSITSPVQSTDRLDITVNSGGDIDLSSLKTIGGNGLVPVLVDNGTLTLGALATVDRTTFNVSGGGSVTTIGKGVTGGGYDARSFFLGGVLLSSAGSGSLLDLSSLASINAGFNDFSGTVRAQRVNATDSGVIDLSGVTSITSPVQSTDRLDFNVNSGGRVDLSSLTSISGGGKVRFNIIGGFVTVGSLTSPLFDVNLTQGSPSVLTVLADVTLTAPTTLVMDQATLQVGGNLSFSLTNEAAFKANDSTVELIGSGTGLHPQLLEVGGTDVGTDIAALGTNPNFGIGQLIIGQDGNSTVVLLVDEFNNGNRVGEMPEALYLFGLGEEGSAEEADGLSILSGSSLHLNGLDLYAFIDADMTGQTDGLRQWEHVNDWFTDLGTDTIAFDGGFLAIAAPAVPEPTTGLILLAMAGSGLLVRRRRVV